MNLIFRYQPCEANDIIHCCMNEKYRCAIPSIAYIYANGDYKDLAWVGKVQFCITIEENVVVTYTTKTTLYSNWNGIAVTIQLLPEYYLHPWKCVMVCVNEKDQTYNQKSTQLKKAMIGSVLRVHDQMDSFRLFCTHRNMCITTINDMVISYIMHNTGIVDPTTLIVFEHNLLYPPIPTKPSFKSIPGCSLQDLLSIYPEKSSMQVAYNHLKSILTWNLYFYQTTIYKSIHEDSKATALPFGSNNILLKGEKGSGKTSTLYSILELLNVPCLTIHSHEMTQKYGSDAHAALRSTYRTCVQMAPSVLLLDPLSEIAADNSSRPIDRSDVDNSLLTELLHILDDSHSSGVTVIGVSSDETTSISRINCSFDETVEFFIPSQQERVYYFHYIIQNYMKSTNGNHNEKWKSTFVNYLGLHSPSFSWTDLQYCVDFAFSKCSHVSGHFFCPLCLLQTLQYHHSDNTILHNMQMTLYQPISVTNSLSELEGSIGDFSGIGGNQSLKDHLYEYIINPNLHSSEYEYFGISPPTGILLYGPPGTGKTAISRACSQLGHLNFISPQISELVCKEIGESERKIRDLFERAHRCSPCIIFFDEIESVFKNRQRDEAQNGIAQQILTQLLLQIDNLHIRRTQGDFVFVIGATNLPEQLDPSLLRPGRLDKHILVPLPSIEEREQILQIYSHDILLFTSEITLNDLARRTEGYSGADIKFLVRSIILCSLDFGQAIPQKKTIEITKDAVNRAFSKVKASTNIETYEQLLKWKPEDNYSFVCSNNISIRSLYSM